MKKGEMKIRGYEYLGRWNNKEFFQGHFYSIEIDHNKNEVRKYYDGSLRGWFSFEELEDLFTIYARKVTRNNGKKRIRDSRTVRRRIKLNDITFYMGLLKIFGKYIHVNILSEEEEKIFDELIYRSDEAVNKS